jgi:hypothetical protein
MLWMASKQVTISFYSYITTSHEVYTFQAWWCRNCTLKMERCHCTSNNCWMQLSSVTELTWLVLQSRDRRLRDCRTNQNAWNKRLWHSLLFHACQSERTKQETVQTVNTSSTGKHLIFFFYLQIPWLSMTWNEIQWLSSLENEKSNSMTFQVFHDRYAPCIRQSDEVTAIKNMIGNFMLAHAFYRHSRVNFSHIFISKISDNATYFCYILEVTNIQLRWLTTEAACAIQMRGR